MQAVAQLALAPIGPIRRGKLTDAVFDRAVGCTKRERSVLMREWDVSPCSIEEARDAFRSSRGCKMQKREGMVFTFRVPSQYLDIVYELAVAL